MTTTTLILATLTLVSDPLAGRLCGKGPTPPEGSSPPMI